MQGVVIQCSENYLGIGATLRTRREIQCLQYEGFFYLDNVFFLPPSFFPLPYTLLPYPVDRSFDRGQPYDLPGHQGAPQKVSCMKAVLLTSLSRDITQNVNKTSGDREKLPREHLIGCQGVK